MSDATESCSAAQRAIVVIGAGIIGLTTAIRILESLHSDSPRVHIIAEHLPTDPPTALYASLMAGAHHLSFADDSDLRQRRWDQRTFKVMRSELEQVGEESGLMEIKQTEYYVGEKSHLQIYEEHPNFCVNNASSLPLPFHVDHSISFTSLTMTPSVYLPRLIDRFTSLSGILHRQALQRLADFSSPTLTRLIGGSPSAIVVCTGLGSLMLGQVEDHEVYPVRGQIIKVNAPWIKEGFTRQVGSLAGGEGGERTYVIPRMTGEVILGGTRDAGDWEEQPREETGKDIMQRAVEICPDLARDGNGADSLVVSHLVGFRPAREGGVRLERGPDIELGDHHAAVVYNYGHGGAGWQSCWGCAEDAAELVLETLKAV